MNTNQLTLVADYTTFAEMTISHRRIDTDTTLVSRLSVIDLDQSGQDSLIEITKALAENIEIDYFSTRYDDVYHFSNFLV